MALIRTETELRSHFNITEQKHVLKNCDKGDVEYTIEYVSWLESLVLGRANGVDTRTKPVLPIQNVTNSALILKVQKLEAENKLLSFMVENGLGEEDMLNDITLPHDI